MAPAFGIKGKQLDSNHAQVKIDCTSRSSNSQTRASLQAKLPSLRGQQVHHSMYIWNLLPCTHGLCRACGQTQDTAVTTNPPRHPKRAWMSTTTAERQARSLLLYRACNLETLESL